MSARATGQRAPKGKMPSDAMPAAMEAPSAKGKMPHGAMSAAMETPFAKGKMPGGAMPAAMETPFAKGKMPRGAMPAAMETPFAKGKMPGGAMPAAMEAPFAKGKMPGVATSTVLQELERAAEQYKVFVKRGESIPGAALAALGPYTLRSSSANFDVYYDNSLGTNGQNLADAVLANCERDLFQLNGWFGGVAAGRFSVYIDPGSFGAYHATCPATEIHCAAFTGTDGQLVNMLNVAEVVEVMEARQGAGWNCGASAGEGLSRGLSAELYPASLGVFATASSWLDSGRPDWVTHTEATDRDYVSIGCATLFLNYLRYQLHLSLARIVQAGGTTLQQTYQRLTNSSDAFGPFAALLQRHFPAGTPVSLTGTDNVFPLLDPASWEAGSMRGHLSITPSGSRLGTEFGLTSSLSELTAHCGTFRGTVHPGAAGSPSAGLLSRPLR